MVWAREDLPVMKERPGVFRFTLEAVLEVEQAAVVAEIDVEQRAGLTQGATNFVEPARGVHS
jgi:hypothetical protein